MKSFTCPSCGANKLSYVSDRTMKCEYCDTTFLIDENEIPEDIIKAEFGTKDFADNMLRYLSSCSIAPADIFDAKFEEVKTSLRSFRNAHYDTNLIYQRENLDPARNKFVPYYSMRYTYRGKAYQLSSYGIGKTKSYGMPPNVMDSINETVLKSIGKDTIGVIALIVGFLMLFIIDSTLVRIISGLLFAAGAVITFLFYKKFKKEKVKAIEKNNSDRKTNYLKYINKENDSNI